MRGGAVTVLAGVGSVVISMGSTAVLARLLTPADFGLIGMVSVITGFIVLFKDMGLSAATIQQAQIDHRQISTLFWINLIISFVIMLVTMSVAPLIAWFYDEPQLMWVTLIQAPGQLISGLSIQHQALMKRQMRFTSLAVINIIGQVCAIGVAVVMAMRDMGVWSLAVMPVSNAFVTLILLWLLCGWRPGAPVRGSGVRKMLRFGGNLTGFNVVNYFVRNLDNLLIGKIAGSEPLGLYSKAYSLLMLPIRQINTPITSVAIPALSRLQKEPQAYRHYYLRAVGLIVFFGMPVVAFATATADKIVLILLGDQWTDAVTLFIALSPAAFVGTFNVSTGWVYMSMGTTDRQFRNGIVSSLITCIGFAIGIRWGALGVAISLSAVFVLIRPWMIAYCFKGTPLKPLDLYGVLWRPALAALAAGAIVFAVDRNRTWAQPTIVLFTLDTLLYAAAYLLAWMLLPGGRFMVYDTLKLAREFKRRPASQNARPQQGATDSNG